MTPTTWMNGQMTLKLTDRLMELRRPHIVQLPKILDERGNLSFIQNEDQIPFAIRRAYWIYDVPGGEQRGGHAYKKNKELIVALSGSLDVKVTDGHEEETYHLNRSYYGLYVPNGFWREMSNFSTNSFALILASEDYNEEDYIREYEEFLKAGLYEGK